MDEWMLDMVLQWNRSCRYGVVLGAVHTKPATPEIVRELAKLRASTGGLVVHVKFCLPLRGQGTHAPEQTFVRIYSYRDGVPAFQYTAFSRLNFYLRT